MAERYNVASALSRMAVNAPYQTGVVFPDGRNADGREKIKQISFLQLHTECDRYAHGLSELGIKCGDRVLLLIKPGATLVAVVFALLKMGAVPVIIDPGMGRRAFLQCVSESEPNAFIGIPAAQLLRKLMPAAFRSVKHSVIVNGPALFADATLNQLRTDSFEPYQIAPTTTENEAAVAFTSGSTGIPKGVVYTHGMFKAQITLLQEVIGIQPGEVDLALLYIFAFFNPALGVTTIFPEMDPAKSAEINPAYVVQSVRNHHVTNAFGSPTIWKRVVPYCAQNGIRLTSLKRVIMAGAPVPPELIRAMYDSVLDAEAKIITPYGSTEAMPLTQIDGHEILEHTAELTHNGKGMCVGIPMPGIEIRVIQPTDEPIEKWDESLVLPVGEIGEIVVKAPLVTRTYVNRPHQTALAKIREGDAIWHRMGDVGYFDNQGRLWFCGRKNHRVFTKDGILYPIQCEPIFNRHPSVFRSALVGVGVIPSQRPVLIVECEKEAFPTTLLSQQQLIMELLALGAGYSHTRSIQDILFYSDIFPTDVRHNVKIQREKLAIWASHQLHITSVTKKDTAEDSTKLQQKSYKPNHLVPAILGSISLVVGLVASVLLITKKQKTKQEFDTGGKKEA